MSTEDDQMILGLKNCYGTGTRSYNRSGEKREMDKQRKRITESYVHESVDAPLVCWCLSFQYPHFLEAHKQLQSEHDWSEPHARYKILWEDLR